MAATDSSPLIISSTTVDRRTRKGRRLVEDENHRLKELVGQQALIIEAQKKLAGILPRR